ncbi:hypothetical protein MKX07_000032 [Trichoderma sp. CBMAI-0711]|nr:hypothetical protein MKX07_000032 [Trichoderma sp. CBMAI-0711]
MSTTKQRHQHLNEQYFGGNEDQIKSKSIAFNTLPHDTHAGLMDFCQPVKVTSTSSKAQKLTDKATDESAQKCKDKGFTFDKKTMWAKDSNIGARAREPNWTDEQIQTLSAMAKTKLPLKDVSDTRRVVPDPNGTYVTYDDGGAALIRSPAFLNNIDPEKYCIGMGRVKGDLKTGNNRLYSDVVMRSRDGTWITNQWTCKGIVIEGVPRKTLDKRPQVMHASARTGKERRIGHEFVRIGLPRMYFAPVLETLKSEYPSLLDRVVVTVGYYWLYASWGVTGTPGKYKYMAAPGRLAETQELSEILRMANGQSCLCQATIAISTAFSGKLSGNMIVRDGDGCSLSIKLHNALHLKMVDYRSPPPVEEARTEANKRNSSKVMSTSSNRETFPVKVWSKDFIVSEKSALFMTPRTSDGTPAFVSCDEAYCNFNTGVGESEACTLRLGFNKCMAHMEIEDVEKHEPQVKNPGRLITVYYGIQLSNDGEVEQIGARTNDGYTFSGIIRTSVRTNKSPILRRFRADVWNLLASDPRSVMQSFVDWMETLLINSEQGSPRNLKIMLIAHNGVLFNHLHLLRTMLKHGIEPPDILLSDSMAILKIMIGKNETTELVDLGNKYVPWIDHTPRDADSEAQVLMAVMKQVFRNPSSLYTRFSIHCTKYMTLVGLSMYQKTMSMDQRIREAMAS